MGWPETDHKETLTILVDCISWLETVPRAMSPATRRRPTTSELEVKNQEKNHELA